MKKIFLAIVIFLLGMVCYGSSFTPGTSTTSQELIHGNCTVEGVYYGNGKALTNITASYSTLSAISSVCISAVRITGDVMTGDLTLNPGSIALPGGNITAVNGTYYGSLSATSETLSGDLLLTTGSLTMLNGQIDLTATSTGCIGESITTFGTGNMIGLYSLDESSAGDTIYGVYSQQVGTNTKNAYSFYADNQNSGTTENYAYYTATGKSLFLNTTINGTLNVTGAITGNASSANYASLSGSR